MRARVMVLSVDAMRVIMRLRGLPRGERPRALAKSSIQLASRQAIFAGYSGQVSRECPAKEKHLAEIALSACFIGVADGTRTHDDRNHNTEHIPLPMLTGRG